MKTAEEYLKEMGISDCVINPEDLSEYHITLSKLLEEYTKQSRQADVSGSLPDKCTCLKWEGLNISGNCYECNKPKY